MFKTHEGYRHSDHSEYHDNSMQMQAGNVAGSPPADMLAWTGCISKTQQQWT
jgi:hypothetical protein